jgi:hypothetical protein
MIGTVASAPRPQVDPPAGSATPGSTDQRDPRGRFAKGNPGGPGNPFARKTAQFRKVLQETVTDEDIQAAARKLIEQARAGDLAAIRLLFSYTIGKPAAAVDPDRVEVEEWKLMQETSVAPQVMSGVLQSLPADWVVRMLQIAWPCVVQTIAQELGADIEALNRQEAARARRAEARHQAEARKGASTGQADGASISQAAPGEAAAVEPIRPSANGSNGAEAEADRPSANGSNGVPMGPPAPGVERLDLSPEVAQLLLDVLQDLPIGNGANGPASALVQQVEESGRPDVPSGESKVHRSRAVST